jgi:hypothetical protein
MQRNPCHPGQIPVFPDIRRKTGIDPLLSHKIISPSGSTQEAEHEGVEGGDQIDLTTGILSPHPVLLPAQPKNGRKGKGTPCVGRLPVKFQFGVGMSVVRQEDFGNDWQVKLNIIPVTPALVGKPLF